MHIYSGTSNLGIFDKGIQFRRISEIFVHPEYSPEYYFNDIAILKMNPPLEISDYVRPVCLWQEDTKIDKLYNQTGLVVGWGYDGNSLTTDSLRGAYMPIVDTQTCIWSNRPFFSRVTFEKNYCAGFQKGKQSNNCVCYCILWKLNFCF